MSVISDNDTTGEALERKLVASGHTHEQRTGWGVPGLPFCIGVWVMFAVGVTLLFYGSGAMTVGIVLLVIFGIAIGGFVVVQPNEARVLILFGRYNGSITEAGLWWCNPFNKRKKISLRVRNFQSDRIKVNDTSG